MAILRCMSPCIRVRSEPILCFQLHRRTLDFFVANRSKWNWRLWVFWANVPDTVDTVDWHAAASCLHALFLKFGSKKCSSSCSRINYVYPLGMSSPQFVLDRWFILERPQAVRQALLCTNKLGQRNSRSFGSHSAPFCARRLTPCRRSSDERMMCTSPSMRRSASESDFSMSLFWFGLCRITKVIRRNCVVLCCFVISENFWPAFANESSFDKRWVTGNDSSLRPFVLCSSLYFLLVLVLLTFLFL